MAKKSIYIVKDEEDKLLAIFTNWDDVSEFLEPYMTWTRVVI